MRKLFKKRKIDRRMLKPMEVNFTRIDNYILKKYGLKDIKNKDLFILSNILFMICGSFAILIFLSGKINVIAVIDFVVTITLGCVIFHRVKEHGVKIEEKNKKEGKEK